MMLIKLHRCVGFAFVVHLVLFVLMLDLQVNFFLDVLSTEILCAGLYLLFDLILNVPVNNYSVMSGRVFLG